ncbi:transcriptional regulator [Lactobacillus sp. ESL0791]|uniref:YlxM family DNA-binding protein n=1 Tax=Lactobacillus sp. ESL0791 TaxID=2983234 RepID=UPI0023F78B71|nr:transcriptional regulator [Lactobacillus sp. ESL0791]MDF7639105.1 transcriptional regulator [Lactobacillus sp. ESL0791]
MDELIKNEQLGDLYAYYGSLLTKGQRSYFEDYYYNDLSLGEIALNHGVSRQAVYDNLRRSSKLLKKYEARLHMQRDYNELEMSLEHVAGKLKQGATEPALVKINELLEKLKGE